MKLSNITMSNYVIALDKIADKVSGKLAYAIARNLRKLTNEVVEYEQLRVKIVEKYGEKTDEGWQVPTDSPNYKVCLEEIKEVGNIEHDVEIFKISEDIVSQSPLSAKEILSIDFMIESD